METQFLEVRGLVTKSDIGMKNTKAAYSIERLSSGAVFYLHRQKCHFVGTLQDGDETLFVYWRYNRYSRRRVYVTQPRWAMEIDLGFAKGRP